MLTVFLIPAFTEELIFRGLFIPEQDERKPQVLPIGLTSLLFVLWHWIEAHTFLPGATLFLSPMFLAITFVLGLSCALMKVISASLWPAICFHGLVVLVWQALFGGPDFTQLLQA